VSNFTFDLNGVRIHREKRPRGVGVADPFQHLVVCPFRVVVDTRENVLMVPNQALKWVGGRQTVFVVDKAGVLRYVQLVKELSNEPNYDEVLQAVGKLT